MKITYLHVGCQEKENKKTKTAFYLACKNPAKMDTTKKEQKKENWSWKKEKKTTKTQTQNCRPLPLSGEDATGGGKDGK